MDENLLDVLLYLFENYPPQDLQDNPVVRDDLDEAGFLPDEVDGAFDWLRGTDAPQPLAVAPNELSTRLYSAVEQMHLPLEARSYLMQLQRHGVLSATTREIVIDRLMALATDDQETTSPNDDGLGMEQIKWVIMLVLFTQDDEIACARMEARLNADNPVAVH